MYGSTLWKCAIFSVGTLFKYLDATISTLTLNKNINNNSNNFKSNTLLSLILITLNFIYEQQHEFIFILGAQMIQLSVISESL